MNDTITITGNVATPPEFKRTPGGVAITTFRLASGLRRYDRTAGAWVDSGTNWYSVSAFRGLADHAFTSLRKGDRVLLMGRLRVRDWDNGTRRGTDVEIDADAIGHDLLWGTTTFVKSSGAAADQSQWQAPPAEGGDAWAAPGIGQGASDTAQIAGSAMNDPHAPDAGESMGGGAARDDGALVGAGGAADSEVPF